MVLAPSNLFVHLREDPVDVEVASHKRLVRAGYIRRAALACTPGYPWPEGTRARSRTSSAKRWTPLARRSSLPRCPANPTPRQPTAGTSNGDNLFRPRTADKLLAPHPRGNIHPAGQGPVPSQAICRFACTRSASKYRDEYRPCAGSLASRVRREADPTPSTLTMRASNEALWRTSRLPAHFERLGSDCYCTAQNPWEAAHEKRS